MKFTFAICYGPNNHHAIESIAISILSQYLFCLENVLETFEILAIGEKTSQDMHASWEGVKNKKIGKWIQFDETQKEKGWITRKKNILAQEAKFENIVFLHDYFVFDLDWLGGWVKFGNDFEIANNIILNKDGTRHSDWTVNMFDVWKLYPEWDWKMWDVNLPYTETELTKIQYISGGYWVAKKQFMLDNPLNEELLWGDKEDIEWSERIRQKTTFKFNPNSIVQIMKPGKWAPGLIDQTVLDKVKGANGL